MRKAVVILPPHQRCNEKVDRRHGCSPIELLLGLLQPFGVLVEHGINDVDEGFITREEPVAASQNVTFKPAFERVLAQHFHHAPGDIEFAAVGVIRLEFGQPGFL